MRFVELVEAGVNTLLYGEFGIGKTHLLNKLAERFNTFLLTSNPSVEELEKLVSVKCKSKKEAYTILLNCEKMTILVDDIHESRKDTISMLLRLCRVHTLVCASERELERLIFDFKSVKVKKFTHEQGMKLCKKFLQDDKVCERIIEGSKGLPLLIIRGVEHYKVTGVVKNYFNVNWKKLLLKRVSVTAYLCLSLRYFARGYNWELYSTLSTIAYALLALNRISKKI